MIIIYYNNYKMVFDLISKVNYKINVKFDGGDLPFCSYEYYKNKFNFVNIEFFHKRIYMCQDSTYYDYYLQLFLGNDKYVKLKYNIEQTIFIDLKNSKLVIKDTEGLYEKYEFTTLKLLTNNICAHNPNFYINVKMKTEYII